MKAKIILGKSLAVFANAIKGIGDNTNNLSGFCSAVSYSPSLLINLGNKEIFTSYFKHTAKDLINGVKQSACELVNPFTISLDKPSGKFSDVIEKAKEEHTEYKNTVEYGTKSEISKSFKKEAADIGTSLRDQGFTSFDESKIPQQIMVAMQNLHSKVNSPAIGG